MSRSHGTAILIIGTIIITNSLLKSREALAGCTRDSECKGARICETGQCVNPRKSYETQSQSDRTSPQTPPAPFSAERPPITPITNGEQPTAATPTMPIQDPNAFGTGARATVPPLATASVLASPRETEESGTVPIRFSGLDGYTVRAQSRTGEARECFSPCTLRLNAEQTNVSVVGYFDQSLDISKETTSARLSIRRTGWAATGLVFAGTGFVQAAVGLVATQAWCKDCEARANYWAMAGIGLVLGAAGVTTAVLALRTRSEIQLERLSYSASGARGLRIEAVGPVPVAGGGGLGMVGSY